MILVDTSVLIEFFKGRHNPKAEFFDEVIARDIPFGISAFSYQEVRQERGSIMNIFGDNPG
jgi:predicted nucleic acid-binding protein